MTIPAPSRPARWYAVPMRTARQGAARRLLAAAIAVTLGAAMLPGVLAAEGDVGYRDYGWVASNVNGPTAEKPQSKLWHHDGTWWGVLFNPASDFWEIYRLSPSQDWLPAGTQVDNRNGSWADVLWDGSHLYVASAGRDPANAGDSVRVSRFSYEPATQRYSLDSGFPVTAVTGGMEAIVMDRDSTGKLWLTYTRDNQVWVNRSTTDDRTWGTPFVLPVAGTTVAPDDLSAVVSFGGRIGVMWSNQVTDAFYFSEHVDGAADTAWTSSRTAIMGPGTTDDHVALRSLIEGPDGQVFAVIKTSLNDLPNANPNAPLVMLLWRNGDGSWSSTPVSTVGDDQTRPSLLIDGEHRELYVFATTPIGGGTIESGTAVTAIYYKKTSLSSIAFEAGKGTPLIQSASDPKVNDATSTKQVLHGGTGLVVLASDNSTRRYLHNLLPLGGNPSPSPTSTPSPTPSPTPAASPTPTPAASPTPTASPTPEPTAKPTKKPHPTRQPHPNR